jgi:hypothetical protein
VYERAFGLRGDVLLGDAFSAECTTTSTPLLAIAGRRALWTNTLAGDVTYVDVSTGAPGDEEQLVEELVSDTAYGDGDYVAALAGDGANLAYAVVTLDVPATCRSGGSCDLSVVDGRVMLVTPRVKVRYLKTVTPAVRMALAGDTLAVVPVLPEPAPDRVLPAAHGFLLYRVSTGKTLATVPVAAPIVGLACSPSTVAVLARRGSRTTIARYASPSGRLIDTTPVSGSAADVSVSGSDVVYRTGRTVRLLGRAQPLAVAASTPMGLTVDGTRVAWAENTPSGGQIRTLLLR